MMKNLKFISLLALGLISTLSLVAQEEKSKEEFNRFYVKPYGGFIGIQNMELELQSNNQLTDIEIENGFGYTAGISFGYNFSKNITAEIGWEYKTNEVTVTNNNTKTNGDYASNFIYLNGIYNIDTNGKLKPYLGLGITLIQEIDIDLSPDEINSFSNSGNIGFQGIAGLDFNFSKNWAINWEAKYVTFSQFNMDGESNDLKLKNLKYNPFIFNIGFKYRF